MNATKRPRIVHTEAGWEVEFWSPDTVAAQPDGTLTHIPASWGIESGYALPTRELAQAQLERDLAQAARLESSERLYRSGYDYACGYHD